MKASKRFITWVIISLVLQGALYLYMDKVYFAEENNIKTIKLSDTPKSKDIKANVTFPEGFKDEALSWDKSYTSYFDSGGILKVVDTNSGKFKSLIFSSGAKCIGYKWLPDNNRIMIAEKVSSGKVNVIKFYSYDADADADSDSKLEIKNYQDKKENAITVNQGTPKVDIQVSTLTGVMYAKISNGVTVSNIYRIDRNETMTKVETAGRRIGNIKVASNDDQLVYEDLTANKIRTNYKTAIINIAGNSKLGLLTADGDNNFYLGNNLSGKINKIYYGKLSESTSTWKHITLNGNVDTKNVFVILNGDVYINSEAEYLTNVKTNVKTQYSGKFIGVYDDTLASVDGNKLRFVKINK